MCKCCDGVYSVCVGVKEKGQKGVSKFRSLLEFFEFLKPHYYEPPKKDHASDNFPRMDILGL